LNVNSLWLKLQSKKYEMVFFYLKMGVAFWSLEFFADLVEGSDNLFPRVINSFWLLIYIIVINYYLFEYSIPFLRKSWKRVFVAPFFIFFYLFLFSVGYYAWRFLGIKLHFYSELKVYESIRDGLSEFFPRGLFSAILIGVIRHFYNYQKLKQDAQQLRIEKQEAELNYLRSQTNPHFLFNTLNNIYSLAKDKSDLAPKSIMQLSKLLRYMLYETNADHIAIEQEIKIINDYIDLEKLRYDDSLKVDFHYEVEDMKQDIQPLLLIPLVENAFKHGVSETRNQPFVNIQLNIKDKQLDFKVRNSKENKPQEVSEKETIGLPNLQRQLELIYKDFQLSSEITEKEFLTFLKINLDSHV